MLLHHIHSELLLVHSLQVVLMAHGVRHCLALWLAEENHQEVMFKYECIDFQHGGCLSGSQTSSGSALLAELSWTTINKVLLYLESGK